MEVDLNILVVPENYSGRKSSASLLSLCQFFYRNSLCYVGLRVSVLSITSLIIILVGIFLFRTCLAFSSASQSELRWHEAISLYAFLQEIPWGKDFPAPLCFSHQLSDLVHKVVHDHLVGHRCGSCQRECGISLVAFVPRVCKTKVGLGYLNPLS